MAAAKRGKTKYPGVFFRLQSRLDGLGEERQYYIIYRRAGEGRSGKLIEEPIGRESEGMSAAKANRIRALRASGSEKSNTERRAAAEAAQFAEGGPLTFSRLWLLYHEVNASKPSAKGDAFRYQKHIAPSLAAKLITDISTADIDILRGRMAKDEYSPQTIKNILGQIRRIIRFGIKRGLCDMPTALHFEMPKVDNERTEAFTDKQLAAYLTALDEEPDQNAVGILRLALATGMRRSALLALRWRDCDFERDIITLQGASAKKGKTEFIPMTAAARHILTALDQTSEFVFPGKNGGQRKDFRRIARRVRGKAGLPKDFRPLHGLRHAYASMLISSGQVDLYTLQKLLTHESPAMTQRYSHLRDEALRKAASVINDCLDIGTADK